ncbi:predicted protein [Nematostella vectensis]|uniref:Uncharacterized protein n=1 Tax=Nematostella vectensis TaxID=45351 RepID=A7SMV8_NEMVE|nr:predicted protein [Nematostella vectensis]|eukprot:XP_001627064.1 predicted protein [Nematostella vectensis]
MASANGLEEDFDRLDNRSPKFVPKTCNAKWSLPHTTKDGRNFMVPRTFHSCLKWECVGSTFPEDSTIRKPPVGLKWTQMQSSLQMSGRIQRLRMRLLRFKYTISHVPEFPKLAKDWGFQSVTSSPRTSVWVRDLKVPAVVTKKPKIRVYT